MPVTRVMKDERGFTLISAIMAAAVGSVVVYGLASALSDMAKVQRGVEMSGQVDSIANEARQNFSNSLACDRVLSGAPFSAGGETPLSGLRLTVGGQPVTVTEGGEIAPGIVVTKFRLQTNTQLADAVPVTMKNLPTYYRHQGTVLLQMHKTVGAAQDMSPMYIPISFVSSGQGGGAIANCGSTSTSQTVCESLNYVWDTSTGSCRPANTCLYGGSFGQTSPDVAGYANPLTHAESCPANYTRLRAGTLSVASSCGKYCDNNATAGVYQCVKCLDGNGDITPVTAGALFAASSSGLDLSGEYADAQAYVTGEDAAAGNLNNGLHQPTPPAGSYQASCNVVGCTMTPSGVLTCSCNSATGWHTSSLDTAACTSAPSNLNGQLVCSMNAPTSGYNASCNSISYLSNGTLTATCSDPSGGWHTTSLDVNSCGGVINNQCGTLVCGAAAACANPVQLPSGMTMNSGSSVQSPNGQYNLVMQSDCNLVEYQGGTAVWASNTNGRGSSCYAAMQTDGNLVVYGRVCGRTCSNQALWASGTNGRNGATGALQDDGNLVISVGGTAVWANGR